MIVFVETTKIAENVLRFSVLDTCFLLNKIWLSHKVAAKSCYSAHDIWGYMSCSACVFVSVFVGGVQLRSCLFFHIVQIQSHDPSDEMAFQNSELTRFREGILTESDVLKAHGKSTCRSAI